jgi:hypothetical protein
MFLLVFAFASPAAAQEQVFVDFGSPMVYLANSSDPFIGTDWIDPDFDDATWFDGTYGVGYETNSGAQDLILTPVPDTSKSVYTRTTFTVAEVGDIQNLILGVDYDDGFVAWINGVEVARSTSMPIGDPDWDTPSATHESSNGSVPHYEPYNISTTGIPLLVNGENDLAIGVWNQANASSDLVLAPQLVMNRDLVVERGPYLQLATPTSVIVRWRTNNPVDAVVLCGDAPGNLAPCAEDLALVTEHEHELSGLLPETTYYYAIGTTTEILAGDNPDHFFVTPPLPGTVKPTRMWVIGDSGYGNQDQANVRDSYHAFADGRYTDLWVHVGDVSQTTGTDVQYQIEFFDMYPGLLRTTAFWPTMGNHDGQIGNSDDQIGPYYDNFTLPAAGQAGGLASGTEAYYSFDYGNIHFIVLNSFNVDRSVGGVMLTWLEADLQTADENWIVVVFHHPPYSKGSHDSDNTNGLDPQLQEMRENALPILDDYGVDLVLTGHSHSYERSFLLDGHYGTSDTLVETMKVDGGDGREDGDGAYEKVVRGAVPYSGPGDGIVYAVVGTSGRVLGGPLDHPAMYISLNQLGSLVVDVDGDRLDAWFLDDSCGAPGCTTSIQDYFTIIKSCPSGDVDGDGVCDDRDNCPGLSNPPSDCDGDPGTLDEQCDDDDDGMGNPCDPCPIDPANDGDGDGWCADEDNCPLDHNPSQTDTDGDGDGDACDLDDDADGVEDSLDCAPLVFGVSSLPGPIGPLDLDRFGGATLYWQPAVQGHTSHVYRARGYGDLVAGQFVCMPDADNVEARFRDSQMPQTYEVFYYLVAGVNVCGEGSAGKTSAGIERGGWVPCVPFDWDYDGDWVIDLEDNCSLFPNGTQTDDDLDFKGNVCDNCPFRSNPDQADCNGDGVGNACDGASDCDGDLHADEDDNCPEVPNPTQADGDADGLGDACDACPGDADNDIDDDGLCGDEDNCPYLANPDQLDADGDGIGDACDDCTDTDDDGYGDPGFPLNTCPLDNCPGVSNPGQENFDGDGQGDACDADDDNDGVGDATDTDPLDATVCADDDGDTCDDCAVGTDGVGPLPDNDPGNDGPDNDSDGLCDDGDPDDDNDGVDDPLDSDPFDAFVCRDADGDSCDDCSSGIDNPADDGPDNDTDGLCDDGDPDDDNDGVDDPLDSDPFDAFVCRDADGDSCDDCSSGIDNPADDGTDTDADGLCDLGDDDDDNDGVGDATDTDPLDPTTCADADGDGCDDCAVGQDGFGPLPDNDPANDGPDNDTDGLCDDGDPDDDNDGVDDPLDSDPFDAFVCRDADGDSCDDCSSGIDNPADDGTDTDADGLCDLGDGDDDNDGVGDATDTDPLDPTVCADVDGDTCDDCAVGQDGFGPLPDADPANDGPDNDTDGQCDAGDPDDDNDGVDDPLDSDPFDAFVCRDVDGDTCDDCSSGIDNPADDGTDTDADGLCDLGDGDDDNDGVDDGTDADPLDPTVCADADGDTCDDCAVGQDGFGPLPDNDPANDGPDNDGDGQCDAGDPDDDDDGVDDISDPAPFDPTVCGDSDGDTCDDCSATAIQLLDAGFDDDEEGFVYVDDPFRGTSEPDYADGSYEANGGLSGGGLRVGLGGVDNDEILGMSGGWQLDVDLAVPTELTLSFFYNLTASGSYEVDEFSQVLLSVDGALVGRGPDDFVDQLVGDGNSGPDLSTGWQQFQVELGQLSPGMHVIIVGGYNNMKHQSNEWTEVLLDDVVLTTTGGHGFDPLNDGPDLDGDGLCDAGDPDDDNDGVDDTTDVDPFDPTVCADSDGDTCDDCAVGVDGFGPLPDNDPANDGPDNDSDGLCDEGDPDDDNDGVDDPLDSDPFDAFVCRDADGDGCDDCSSGIDDPADDGVDTDSDGLCNVGDDDDDNDGVDDATDTDPLDPTVCADSDGDGCDDCAVGTDGYGSLPDNDPANDGPDNDSDGLCDQGDPDDDNDGVDDPLDSDPFDAFVCRDADGDGCDDCSSGIDDPDDDGVDTDSDGLCNAGDPDDDNDGVDDVSDPSALDPDVCGDSDGDGCDDCSVGTDDFGPLPDNDPSNDGMDFDSDGLCDAGDPDDDNDGVDDPFDSAPFDPFECRDIDGDTCDDCSSGTNDPANDGADFDADFLCDAGDPDDDNDGVDDPFDTDPFDPFVCQDVDADTCDDCSIGVDGIAPLPDYDPANDGVDTDADGLCDLGDPDDDNDGVEDPSDCAPLTAGVAAAPEPVDATLRLAKEGASTDLTWLRSFQGHAYNVYRGAHSAGTPGQPGVDCFEPELLEPTGADGETPTSRQLFIYLISARNVCGESAAGTFGDAGALVPDVPCDTLGNDSDGDTISDLEDNCPLVQNLDQTDTDGDFVGNACDNCPDDFNPDQSDVDADGSGDVCDPGRTGVGSE